MQDFKNLRVYHDAHALCLRVYEALKDFPSCERYGLGDQLRRASVSVPSNIAEACGMDSTAGFRKFLFHAFGSAKEIEEQLLLSKDLHYLTETQYQELNNQVVAVSKQLNVLIRKCGGGSN